MELLSAALDTVPDGAGRGRSALGARKLINTAAELGNGVLYVRALREASTKEDGVDTEQDP